MRSPEIHPCRGGSHARHPPTPETVVGDNRGDTFYLADRGTGTVSVVGPGLGQTFLGVHDITLNTGDGNCRVIYDLTGGDSVTVLINARPHSSGLIVPRIKGGDGNDVLIVLVSLAPTAHPTIDGQNAIDGGGGFNTAHCSEVARLQPVERMVGARFEQLPQRPGRRRRHPVHLH
jgi:hypothetical protein